MEIRWGGSPGMKDGNSRTKSFSSRVSWPWAFSVGRNLDTDPRTRNRACASFSWLAMKRGFCRRAMAMASSRVMVRTGLASWAANMTGPAAAIPKTSNTAVVFFMSILLHGSFGVPDGIEDEKCQGVGGGGG